MFRQKIHPFLLLSGIIILWTITFSLFPLQSESGDVYSYTDENGVIVITNTPLPDKIKSKAKKIGSYKDITDEDRKLWKKEKDDRMQPKTDEKERQGQDTNNKKLEAGEKTGTEAELLEKMRKSDAETGKFVKSVKESKDRAADVLNTLEPLKKFP